MVEVGSQKYIRIFESSFHIFDSQNLAKSIYGWLSPWLHGVLMLFVYFFFSHELCEGTYFFSPYYTFNLVTYIKMWWKSIENLV